MLFRSHEREKLERLCRYITRPAVSTERLSLTAQGNIRYRLKTPYRDGTTDGVFEPLDKIAGSDFNSRRLARRAKGRMPGVFHGSTSSPGADTTGQPHAPPRRVRAEPSTA